MSYRLYRHPEVAQDLFDIVDLIARYAGPDVAERKLGAIEQRLDELGQTPNVGTLRHDIYPNLRAIPVARKGVITFIVDDETRSIYIVSITYAGADWLGRVQHREGSGHS